MAHLQDSSVLERLRAQLDDAHQNHLANGIFVEVCTDNLNDAIQKQITSRRILNALRLQVAAAEKGSVHA